MPSAPKHWRSLVGDKVDRYRRRRRKPREFFVKWHGMSYWRCSWITEFWLERYQPRVCICVCVSVLFLFCFMVDPCYNTTNKLSTCIHHSRPPDFFQGFCYSLSTISFYTHPLVEDCQMSFPGFCYSLPHRLC